MKKLTLLLAAGAGYVLGTRAGRERYEQIKSTFLQVKDDPRVQEKAHQAAEVAREQAPVVAQKASEVAGAATGKVAEAAGAAKDAAKDKVSGSGGAGDPDPELLEQLHPDSTAHQDHPGPRGDLP